MLTLLIKKNSKYRYAKVWKHEILKFTVADAIVNCTSLASAVCPVSRSDSQEIFR